jgi:hypothetical protein
VPSDAPRDELCCRLSPFGHHLLADRGERRARALRDVGVIEADHRQTARHVEIGILGRLHHTVGDAVRVGQ